MRESHPRDALPRAGRFELSQVPISQPVRAFSRYGTLNPLPSTDPIGGSGLIEQQAVHAQAFGLGWIVITDHGGALHQKFGVEKTFRDIALAREQHRNLLIFQGMEWNPPAGDHSTVFVAPGANEATVLKEFEGLFDASVNPSLKPSSAANEEKAREAVRWLRGQVGGRVDAAIQILNHPSRSGAYAPAEIRGLRDAAPGVAIGMEGAPGHQAAGIPGSEGGPGEGRGFYDGAPGSNSYPGYPLDSYRTYGGFDWLTARLGGVWDSMLAEGQPYFISATSDSHQNFLDSWTYGGAPTAAGTYFDPIFTREPVRGRGDFYPGAYSRTVVGVQNRSYRAVMAGLQAGRSYAVHGNLVDGLEMDVAYEDQIGTFGDTLRRGSGRTDRRRPLRVTVRARLRRTPNANGDTPVLRRVDLIAGPVTGPVRDQNTLTAPRTRVIRSWELSRRQIQAGEAEFTHRFTEIDGPCYLRIRGTDGNNADSGRTGLEPRQDVIGNDDPWKDLWFYANPIFVS